MPLFAAAAGGLLLHVVLHGAADDPPSKLSQRVLELASLVAGLVLIPALGGGHDHDHPGHVEHGPETGFFVDLLALTEQAAPLLAVGLLVVLALPAKGAEQRLLRFDFVALRSLPWSALGVVTAAALETVLGLGPLAGLGRGWVAVWIALSVAVPTLQGLPDARSLRTSAAMLGLTLAIVATGFALAVTSTEQLGGAVALAALALVVLRIALLSGVREIFAHLHPTSHGEHHG